MIFNNADNMMFGNKEVDKVYYHDEVVWERHKYDWISEGAAQKIVEYVGYKYDHKLIDGKYFYLYLNWSENPVTVSQPFNSYSLSPSDNRGNIFCNRDNVFSQNGDINAFLKINGNKLARIEHGALRDAVLYNLDIYVPYRKIQYGIGDRYDSYGLNYIGASAFRGCTLYAPEEERQNTLSLSFIFCPQRRLPNSILGIGIDESSVIRVCESAFRDSNAVTKICINTCYKYNSAYFGDVVFEPSSFENSTINSIYSIGNGTLINHTTYGCNSFSRVRSLKYVNFTMSRETTIGKNAFYGCKSLVGETFKRAIKYVPLECGIHQNGLKYTDADVQIVNIDNIIDFSGGLTIDYGGFVNCTSIECIKFRGNVTLKDYVFDECNSLKCIYIDGGTKITATEKSFLNVVNDSNSSYIFIIFETSGSSKRNLRTQLNNAGIPDDRIFFSEPNMFESYASTM